MTASMRVFERRGLTKGEIALGHGLFGDEVAWERVHIMQAPPLGFGAMVPFGRTIFFSNWRAERDFAHAKPTEQGWFLHELAHVWQAARGVTLAFAKTKAFGKKAYKFSPHAHASLADYNIEQQAEIVRCLFHARRHEVSKVPLDWLERVWGTR
jgi:type VI secretion system secreted protein VgrG